MMEDKAKLQFYPWHREGMAALIGKETPRVASQLGENTPVRAKLTLNVNGVSKALEVHGPGDVLGIDERQVVRTEPPALSHNFETNFRPYIEFDRPDFPWIFTPLKSNGGELIPWICLIVLKKDAIVALENNPGRPLPQLTCRLEDLPDLSQASYWAHAQHAGSDAGIKSTDDTESLSRLVAPFGETELQAKTAYQAFVVPVFNVGRQAGLKEKISTTLDWAWEQDGTLEVNLPVYYSWEFSTAQAGDFESMARRIKPWPVPDDIGTFEMDAITKLPKEKTSLSFAGALVSPKYKDDFWPLESNNHSTNFSSRLQKRFEGKDNIPIPMYGKWHAKSVVKDSNAPKWLKQLNLDPRLRVAAGLGAQVIKNRQESLMKVAWQQIEQVEDANRVLRQAQLARGINQALFKKVDGLSNTELVQFSAMAHSGLLLKQAVSDSAAETFRAHIEKSRLPDQFLSASFRRFSRPANLRRKKIKNVAGVKLIADYSKTHLPDLTKVPDGLASIANFLGRKDDGAIRTTIMGYVGASNVQNGSDILPEVRRASGGQMMLVFSGSDTIFKEEEENFKDVNVQRRLSGQGVIDENVARATLKRMEALFIEPEVIERPVLDIKKVTKGLKVGMGTNLNINAFANARVRGPEEMRPHADKLATIMHGPIFDEPVYDDLASISNNMLLPGIENVPRNSVSLLSCNNAFVNAFMVGLNFEMARELLWRGYPTDQRGTYFKNFWPRHKSKGHDIQPITDWGSGYLIAKFQGEGTDDTPGLAVFLIRGELLQRYPGLVVSAVKAKMKDKKRFPDLTDPSENEKFPIFSGVLGKDTHFFGFQLDVNEMLSEGEVAPGGHAGWYLLLEQQATEMKFEKADVGKHAYDSFANPIRLYFHADSLLNSSAKESDHGV